ncbi:transglutaminase family protein [Pacificimonas sp. WHA3]|uniref:Transglutaminase family protein n=1 Tax=Pacificimonas pallii TaxID=2827236 RepID=A0ABS6SDL1_9SPHN|nr:transglutaminase family protein [Pacificimonas pallii]MBV7256435.1 transglutaminase family protein [Pacificimonas pallii]
MRINVKHETTYRYDAGPRRVMQLLRLTPEDFEGQNVVDWSIDLNCDAKLRQKRDPHGNITHMLTVDHAPEELVITASGIVECDDSAGLVRGVRETLSPLTYLQVSELTQPNAAIAEFAADAIASKTSPLDKAHALLAAVYGHMKFETGTTNVTTSAAEAFANGNGVCQDLSHLFCAAARSQDIPARYVSGHLFRRDGENNQEASHAWAEAWVQDLGWVAFDPAHGISADDHYVRIAVGMDYRQAAPMVGTRMGGGMETMAVTATTSGRALRQSQNQTMGDMSQSQQ